MIYNGIIFNGVTYRAREVSDKEMTSCEHCDLRELCDSLDIDPCSIFEGVVNFKRK